MSCISATFTQNYVYDALNRIQSVTESGAAAWSRNFTYDQYGNRGASGLQVSVATPASTTAYVASTNRLTTTWATYDNGGNLTVFKNPNGTSPGRWTAGYDGENKQRYYCAGVLTACTAATHDVEYVYDGEGNRVLKQVTNGATTTYVYDAFGRLAAEYTVGGPAKEAGTFYRMTDHLGSTRLVINSAGGVKSRRDFFPFGEQIDADATSGRIISGSGYNVDMGFPQLFTAKERDDESGLDYFGARYMGSSLGRFTSPDAPFLDQTPVDPQSWNLYAYVRNNPLVYIDPTGQAIQLLGEIEEDRQAELEAIRASLVNSKVAGQLTITQNDGGQFFVGIDGDTVAFQKAGDLEADLGALIASDTTAEFTLNDATSTKGGFLGLGNNADVGNSYGGAVTHRSDVSWSGNIQVVVDPNGIKDRLGEAPVQTLGESVAHELLGHAIGFVYAPLVNVHTTNRRAVDAENRARGRGGPQRGTRTTHFGGFPTN